MVSDEERRNSRLSFLWLYPTAMGRLARNTHVIETDFPAIVA